MLLIEKDGLKTSSWFAWGLALISLLYLSFWVFSIHLSSLQRASHLEPVLPVVAEDSAEYDALTQSLLRGEGLSMNGELETLRTPGYPLFAAALSKIGGSYFAVTFAQILLALISAMVIRRIGMRFASQRVGEIVALLFLLNPVTITLSLLLYSDILFLFLFVSGFYIALSLEKEGFTRQTLIASLLFGLAIYVRPISLLALPIFVAPIIASTLTPKLKWKAVGMLVACLAVLVTPWMVRNYLRTGVFDFTSITASCLTFTAARFMAITDGISIASAYSELKSKIGAPESQWRDIRLSRKIIDVTEGVILAHPFSYAAYHLTASLPFLFPSTIAFAKDTYDTAIGREPPFAQGAIQSLVGGDVPAFFRGIASIWWKILERLGWLCVLLIALYTVWTRRTEPLAWAFALVIGWLMLLAGPAVGPRYTLQALPFLFILFVSGCGYLYAHFHFRASK